jgi:hypothetical protein
MMLLDERRSMNRVQECKVVRSFQVASSSSRSYFSKETVSAHICKTTEGKKTVWFAIDDTGDTVVGKNPEKGRVIQAANQWLDDYIWNVRSRCYSSKHGTGTLWDDKDYRQKRKHRGQVKRAVRKIKKEQLQVLSGPTAALDRVDDDRDIVPLTMEPCHRCDVHLLSSYLLSCGMCPECALEVFGVEVIAQLSSEDEVKMIAAVDRQKRLAKAGRDLDDDLGEVVPARGIAIWPRKGD